MGKRLAKLCAHAELFEGLDYSSLPYQTVNTPYSLTNPSFELIAYRVCKITRTPTGGSWTVVGDPLAGVWGRRPQLAINAFRGGKL